MRNTVFPTHPATVQHLVSQPNDMEIGFHRKIAGYSTGQPKEMKRILHERVDGLHARRPGPKRKAKGETVEQYTGRILVHKACRRWKILCLLDYRRRGELHKEMSLLYPILSSSGVL